MLVASTGAKRAAQSCTVTAMGDLNDSNDSNGADVSDVKRYDREHEDVPLEECESENGDMVLWEDHTRALAEKDDVIAGLQRLVRNLNADVAWRSEVAAGLQRDNEALQRQVTGLELETQTTREALNELTT